MSSIVCFHLFVRAALRQLMGHPAAALRRVHARLAAACRLDKERPEYQRVRLSWQPPSAASPSGAFLAESTGGQRSSRLLSVRSTLGLLDLPQGTDGQSVLPEGSVVECILMDDLRNMPTDSS